MKAKPYQKRYIRFGDIPESGKSKIHIGGEVVGEEIGVSCYNATWIAGNYRIVLPRLDEQNLNGLYPITNSEFKRKKVYLVSGDCIGIGSDGEPLLQNIRIQTELILDCGIFYKAGGKHGEK